MAYAALGKDYTVSVSDWSIANKYIKLDIPVEEVASDIASGAVSATRDQLPSLVESVRSDVTLTVAKGTLAALAIGAAAVLGYQYLLSNR